MHPDSTTNNAAPLEPLGDLPARILEAIAARDMPVVLALLTELTRIRPDTPLLFHIAGLVSLRLDEVGKALEALTLAQGRAPGVAAHSEVIAIVHARLGNVVDALFNHKLALAATEEPEVPDLVPDWLGSFNRHFYNMDDQPLLRRGDDALARGDLITAEKYFRQAGEVDAGSARAWRGLAMALIGSGRGGEAIDALLALRKIDTGNTADVALLGQAMALAGEWGQALDCFRHAAANAGEDAVLAFALVRALLCQPVPARAEAADAMRHWGEKFAAPLLGGRPDAAPEPFAGRRLRIGVLSSCWQDGGPLELLVPLLLALPAAGAELYVYADRHAAGTLSRKVEAVAASWQNLTDQDDETAAFLMGNDALDVLVDLDGPLRRQRLAIFARRPAPALLSLHDLPEAAGACGFDLVLGDAASHPEDEAGPVLRVPGIAVTLPDLLELFALPYAPEPGRSGIAFGTSARCETITPKTVALWADILRRLPDARFLLSARHTADSRALDDLVARFTAEAVAGQIVLIPVAGDPMDYFNRLDLLLDPPESYAFTESIAAAAGGLPIVTLPGGTPESRILGGWLTRLGLGELVAADRAGYVAAAVAAATEALRPRLQAAAREAAKAAPSQAAALVAALRQIIAERAPK